MAYNRNPIILQSRNGIFRCFKCKTHIALSDNHYLRETLDRDEEALGFNEVVNVVISTAESRFVDNDLALVNFREVRCMHCHVLLGSMIVSVLSVSNEELHAAAEGRFVLRRDMLEEVGGKGKGIEIEENAESSKKWADRAERVRRYRLRTLDRL